MILSLGNFRLSLNVYNNLNQTKMILTINSNHTIMCLSTSTMQFLPFNGHGISHWTTIMPLAYVHHLNVRSTAVKIASVIRTNVGHVQLLSLLDYLVCSSCYQVVASEVAQCTEA